MTDRPSESSLASLSPAEWPRVRDIIIPLHENDGSGMHASEYAMQQAVAFIGEPKARRLWDEQDAGSMARMISLLSKVDPQVQLGYRRFRLEEGEISFRAQLGETAGGRDLTLRALPRETPHLNDLRMPASWRALMLDQTLLYGGLLLIVAPNGQGKTTTASSIVRSRLSTFGGFANTIEDPVELPLQGTWGSGVCMQRPAHRPATGEAFNSPGEGYHRALIDALRQFPAITGGGTMLFVGEIGDAQTAAETLKAAANGHLVIATLHAKSVAAALRRMVTLASGGRDSMDAETVRELLSDSLRAVFLQSLVWDLPMEGVDAAAPSTDHWGMAQIKGEVLWAEAHASQVSRAIRAGDYDTVHKLAKAQTLALQSLDDGIPKQGSGAANPSGSVVRAALKQWAGAPLVT